MNSSVYRVSLDIHKAESQAVLDMKKRDTDSRQIQISLTENGKPYFPDSPWHFSISHTEHYAFCALSRQNIGLDAEEKGRKVSPAMVEKFLSPTEKSWIGHDPQDVFLRLWVLKEALAKLSGKGIGNWMKNTDFHPFDQRIQEINGCYIAVLEDNDAV